MSTVILEDVSSESAGKDVMTEIGKILMTFAIVFALLIGIFVAVLTMMGSSLREFMDKYIKSEPAKAVHQTIDNPNISVKSQNHNTGNFGMTPITKKPMWQTKAPIGTTGPPINTPSNGSQSQPKITTAKMPGPLEHPFDPKFPPKFPSTDPKNQYTGVPITQKAIDINKDFNNRSPAKIPTTPAPMFTNFPKNGTVTKGPIVPHTLKPTLLNQYRLSQSDNKGICPVIQPSGKLALASEAWNQGKRHGHVTLRGFNNDFDDGYGARDGTIDMGRDGGWYDVETKGCCDHYCREVSYSGVWRWSCIPPQAPNSEYSTIQPKGNQCSALAGPMISKNIHPASS